MLSHNKHCPQNGSPKMDKEVKRNGLYIVISFKCNACGMCLNVEMQSRSKVKGTKHHATNIAAVWRFMSAGSGYANLKESFSVLDIPIMTEKVFLKTANFVGGKWRDILVEEMLLASRKERGIALGDGKLDESVPAIDVIVDSDWSTRSHQDRYTAKSGVACIIGQKTKKLLFLRVRNKFCSVCAIATRKKETIPKYKCFKNWNTSSSSMEEDIIVEGFIESKKVHGLRYTGLVGDRDSSVYKSVLEKVVYGRRVKKLECANHVVRCYRKSLHELLKLHPEWKGRNGLTQQKLRKITAGARAEIRMHSTSGDVQALRRDLLNGPNHVFGDHHKCNKQFCKTKQAENPRDNEKLNVKATGSNAKGNATSDPET